MKVAVIGVGSMGQNHARIYANHENVELVAIADPNKEFLERVARKCNTKMYLDYKEMLEKEEIDAVSIAVPTKFHHEVATHVLNLKKHVLLEKPIASHENEASQIIECANQNNVKLMIGHIERFNPAIIELKKRLHELGEIYKVDVQRIGPFPARITDVGVIVDLSVHDIDVINYLIDNHPQRIYAETQQKLHPSHEDSVTALLKYSSGMVATITVNYLSPTKIRQLQISGSKGMFKVDYLSQELYFYENPGCSPDNWDSVTEGDMRKINIQKREPLLAEIEAFLTCIKENEESPVTGVHGLQVLKIAHDLLNSAKESKIIERP